MPIPKPNPGENEKDFVSRCMANNTMLTEFPDQKIRAGVCYSQFRKKTKESMNTNGEYITIPAPGVSGGRFQERNTRRTDVRGMKVTIGYMPDGSSELLDYRYHTAVFSQETARAWIAERNVHAPREWKIGQSATESIERDLIMLGILRERSHPTALPSDLKIDKEARMIRGIALVNSKAQNGRRFYSADVLNSSTNLFEGVRSFLDHPAKRDDDTDTDSPRAVNELLGKIVNVKSENTGKDTARLRADLQVFPKQGDWIFETAEQFPDMVGMSINAWGKLKRSDGKEIVESIDRVDSVDLVTDMGATVSIFESQQKAIETQKQEEEKAIMDRIKELETELAALNEKIQGLEKDNSALKEEKEKLIQERDGKEKEIQITKILDEQEIPKGARTEEILEAIRALEGEEKIKKFVSTLKKISKEESEIPEQEENTGMKESKKELKKEDVVSAIRG